MVLGNDRLDDGRGRQLTGLCNAGTVTHLPIDSDFVDLLVSPGLWNLHRDETQRGAATFSADFRMLRSNGVLRQRQIREYCDQ